MQPLFEVVDLGMRFGGLQAVDGITFHVERKQIFALIGPNGAGKTTVFNCISGFYPPTHGQILLEGYPLHRRKSHQIARLGITRTFQNVRLFKKMTVVENVMVAQHRHLIAGLLPGLLQTAEFRRAEQRALEEAAFWLEKVGLLEYANREAGTLAYGQQRRLEIARCMITRPKLLLLDEPAAGLNPQETHELDQLISQLREQYGIAILLIEHDMNLVMRVADQILVMEYGRAIAQGTPAEIRTDSRVIKAYLGEA